MVEWYMLTGAAFEDNMNAFKRYSFRPRMLRDVTSGSTETTFMGMKSTLPIFIAPAAMARLGHPLGEVNLTKGAGETGIVQGVSIHLPSYSVHSVERFHCHLITSTSTILS